MFLEELQELIRKVWEKIEEKKKELKKKEADYEELLNLKNGLNRVMEQFYSAQEKDKSAMQSDIFERNRCLQRFRDGMLEQLGEGRSSKPSNSVMTALESVSRKLTTTKEDIFAKETEIEDLKAKLTVYETQIASAVSMIDNGGDTYA